MRFRRSRVLECIQVLRFGHIYGFFPLRPFPSHLCFIPMNQLHFYQCQSMVYYFSGTVIQPPVSRQIFDTLDTWDSLVAPCLPLVLLEEVFKSIQPLIDPQAGPGQPEGPQPHSCPWNTCSAHLALDESHFKYTVLRE